MATVRDGWLSLLALLLFVAATPAAAHTRSESFSNWRIEGSGVIGRFQVDTVRVTQLVAHPEEQGRLDAVLARHLAATVSLTQGDAACAPGAPQPLAAQDGRLRTELRFDCPLPLAETPATLRITAFREASPGHVHYGVVGPKETLFTATNDAARVGGPEAEVPQGVGDFVALGFGHVLSGADHLAFLLALALLAGTPWRAALAATGFTVGHSITLGLTAAGRLHPDGGAVEALIGFTVVYAAWEALGARLGGDRRAVAAAAVAVAVLPLVAAALGRAAPPWPVYVGVALFAVCLDRIGGAGARWTPVLLASAFGLVHGAGFAGALIELELPRERLLSALLGFNIGVEAAQLLALAVLWAAALAAQRLPAKLREQGFVGLCTLLAIVGSYWFVARTIG